MVGKYVTDAFLNILDEGLSLEAINHTYVALIPKKKWADYLVGFRQISLCNVVYKLVRKVIANNLTTCWLILFLSLRVLLLPKG